MNIFNYIVCKDKAKFTTFLCSSDAFEACLSSLKMSLQCVIADLLIIECFSHLRI